MHRHPFPPTPVITTTTITAAVLFFSLLPYFTTSHPCSSSSSTSCPPFSSTPPFPFSSSLGCGHPAFQIDCSNISRATISINNLNFSLLNYQPNSTSLILSPHPTAAAATATIPSHNCSSSHSLSIPSQPINLSASPFRVSDSSCSRLSVLKPCPPPNLPNCSHCSWQCKLIETPIHLVQNCAAVTTHQVSPQGCQSDVLEFLERFLKLGIEIEWDEEEDSYFSNCKACQSKHGVCGFNSSDPNKQFICFGSSSQIKPVLIRQKSPNRIAVLCITFLFIFFLLAVLIISTLISRSRRKSLSQLEDPALLYLHRHRSASLLPPVFTFEELQLSTNNFDPKRKIGDGGFGVVFLGQLYDNRIVAVKYLHRQIPATKSGAKSFSAKSFCNEILILSSINHPNLVKLHGYCSDPRGLILVYEYVANGTLADHLHGTKSFHRKGSLTWQIRIDIALQIAVAMEYLHFLVVPPIVHRDITSNNIFVERDMRVKVGDFGLSRLLVCSEATTVPRGDSDCVWTGPQGTPGYLDPDYYKSFRLTEKSDVYSFGVVLLELVTGKKAVDHRREKREMALADMVVLRIHMGLLKEVVDPILAADMVAMEGVGAVAELAFRCVAAEKDDRPNAREVVEELRSIRGRTRGLRISNFGSVVVPESGSL